MTKKNSALIGFLIGFMLTMGMCAVEAENKVQFTSTIVVALIVGGIFGILGSLLGKDVTKDQSIKPPTPPDFRI
ncbi:MAG: hypothetical protein KAY48_03260 [Saprospiraceae bacterium]|nr:hypothetical protein [Saprospiraceae bacterium]